jgi:AAA+ ATPase superfamily predicted ATPase
LEVRLEQLPMFVDRESELAFLDQIVARPRPGSAQFVLVYGRRRVGKTSLLRHWADQTGLPAAYWTAEKEPAALQRRKLYAQLLGLPAAQAPTFAAWSDVWQAVAAVMGDRRQLLILDELPYAIEADPAFLSSLQHAWDNLFQRRQAIIVLCGSHVRVMESLQAAQSPLFGRLTGQWHLQPLPFSALSAFFPTWPIDDRIAAYAVVGGIPAYLSWLDPARPVLENLRHVLLAPGSMFAAEPAFLLYDEVREPQAHLAILKAIGAGAHTFEEIAAGALISKTHLSSYLVRLQALRLVERRLPATVPPAERRTSHRGRYHLRDAYFRFYFRFLAPALDVAAATPETIFGQIQADLRGFVGGTAFEDLARQWVVERGRAGALPFTPAVVGSHWSRTVQVDVVAVNWQTRNLLLGECKWQTSPVEAPVARELIGTKTPLVLRDLPSGGRDWTVHHALFARVGATAAARQELQRRGGFLVDAETLDRDLR